MRSEVVSSSICSHGRSHATALYEPGAPGTSVTWIWASRSGYRALESALGLGSALM